MAEFFEITDFSAPELDVYARLGERELLRFHEPRPGIFIAESPKVIGRALDAGYRPVSMLVERRQADGEARDVIARAGNIPVYTAELDVLKQLTGFPLTRGVLCAMERRSLPDARELLAGLRRVVVLERVMNPTNVGAIFRSAAALGMEAVLLTEGSCDPLYRRAARVSMGTVFQVPWTFIGGGAETGRTDCVQSLDVLKALNFTTVAMALRADTVRIDDPALRGVKRLAVVLGSEGDGLAEETIAACDYTVKIPMQSGVDSLNVAAASAVAFWELTAAHRQRETAAQES